MVFRARGHFARANFLRVLVEGSLVCNVTQGKGQICKGKLCVYSRGIFLQCNVTTSKGQFWCVFKRDFCVQCDERQKAIFFVVERSQRHQKKELLHIRNSVLAIRPSRSCGSIQELVCGGAALMKSEWSEPEARKGVERQGIFQKSKKENAQAM